jgi:hypothetical protein
MLLKTTFHFRNVLKTTGNRIDSFAVRASRLFMKDPQLMPQSPEATNSSLEMKSRLAGEVSSKSIRVLYDSKQHGV